MNKYLTSPIINLCRGRDLFPFSMTSRPKPDLNTKTHKGRSPFGPFSVTMLALAGLAMLVLSVDGCGGVRPYRSMVKAARSELSPVTLARDQRLKLQLRKALLLDETYAGLSISPHVYMERGFVVGLVDSEEQADGILRAAQTVQGLRSLKGHLPVRKQVPDRPDGNNEETGESTSDLTIKAEIKAQLALAPNIVSSQIDYDVLDGNVVLLGVVASEEVKAKAQREALKISGVTDVTNFLLLPESGYMKRRPRLLR